MAALLQSSVVLGLVTVSVKYNQKEHPCMESKSDNIVQEISEGVVICLVVVREAAAANIEFYRPKSWRLGQRSPKELVSVIFPFEGDPY